MNTPPVTSLQFCIDNAIQSKKDVEPFAGRIVAYLTNSKYIKHQKSYEINGLSFGYINRKQTSWTSNNNKEEIEEVGYDMNRFITSTPSDQSFGTALIDSTIQPIWLGMRLANEQELLILENELKTKKIHVASLTTSSMQQIIYAQLKNVDNQHRAPSQKYMPLSDPKKLFDKVEQDLRNSKPNPYKYGLWLKKCPSMERIPLKFPPQNDRYNECTGDNQNNTYIPRIIYKTTYQNNPFYIQNNYYPAYYSPYNPYSYNSSNNYNPYSYNGSNND